MEEVEPRFGVKLSLDCFLGVFSGYEPWSSLLMNEESNEVSEAIIDVFPDASLLPRRYVLPRLDLPESDALPTPSHCPLFPEGVVGRLEFEPRPKLAKLALDRAVFPLRPSSFRSASAVASSSSPDHPSCVPRSRECATLADAWPDGFSFCALTGEGCAVLWRKIC